MSFLSIKNLYCNVGSFELKNINLDMEKGEFLSIIGKSGSGKTVLLESIAGLHKIKGRIELDGRDITNLEPQKRNIGIVYQDYMLFPNMNVRKNILYPTQFKRNFNKKFFDELIGFLDINSIMDRDIKNLSGGEKQKVAIARALISEPKLLLLDEPLNAVDFTFKVSFMNFLKELHRKYELTVLYVTHNFKEAMFFSNRCVVMLNGQIKQAGSTLELFKKPKTKEVAEFLGFKNIIASKLINVGHKGFFSVAPENISITKTKNAKEFYIKAVVNDIVLFNGYYRIALKTKDGMLHAKSKDFNFSEGEQVFVGFDKKDMVFFE